MILLRIQFGKIGFPHSGQKNKHFFITVCFFDSNFPFSFIEKIMSFLVIIISNDIERKQLSSRGSFSYREKKSIKSNDQKWEKR